ncbi:MAG: Dihydroxyacetone kinase family protein [Candidatus Saccharicenans subterraneus]|uniref:Dihydroxyacetone kinase family protein n=1 Tax=Candidatus Saccharicenans subterraneus TaxID=2508984 RepID=A0A3E2BPA0_9BACT|nr:MAG: Dihydroxyacetone kinase family protein [Candidatus Saccharicenans subterraneum]
MKIKYLDGRRLYFAFLAGGKAIIKDFAYLNRINVFPVPDGDTGTNLASTMKAIAEQARPSRSIKESLRSIADAALTGARGNSGLIFAQYIYGLSKELGNEIKISTARFGESVRNAVRYAYNSIAHPQEGTMLTLIREWAEEVYQNRHRFSDYHELLHHSLEKARQVLHDTPKKLAVLKKAGVVDAGAKGFVDFIEGVVHFIHQGSLKNVLSQDLLEIEFQEAPHKIKEDIPFRYCTEALLVGQNLELEKIKEIVVKAGDSAIVGGSETKARFHVHTNHPQELFFALKDLGTITQPKAEDMKLQAEIALKPRGRVALVVDSSCDLPAELLEKNQVVVIPFLINIKEHVFLDKLTISPEKLYELLEREEILPHSAQPSPKTLENWFSFLLSHFESVLVMTISGGLSGYYNLAKTVAEKFPADKVRVVDSRHLSGTYGLIVQRLLQEWPGVQDLDQLASLADSLSRKTELLVDIRTLKYMVKGGRVSPMKGLLARLLNIKPIITLDEKGKAIAAGKSFSRKQNFKKILKMVREKHLAHPIHSFSVVHVKNRERAEAYAREIEKICGRPASFIQDVSPVVGVHNGIGAVGLCLTYE